MNIKKFLLDNLTFQNVNKVLNSIEKAFTAFSKGMNQFSKGMDDMMDQLSSEYKQSDRRRKSRAIKDRESLDKIFSNKSNVKIWGDSNSSNVKIWSDKSKNNLF